MVALGCRKITPPSFRRITEAGYFGGVRQVAVDDVAGERAEYRGEGTLPFEGRFECVVSFYSTYGAG